MGTSCCPVPGSGRSMRLGSWWTSRPSWHGSHSSGVSLFVCGLCSTCDRPSQQQRCAWAETTFGHTTTGQPTAGCIRRPVMCLASWQQHGTTLLGARGGRAIESTHCTLCVQLKAVAVSIICIYCPGGQSAWHLAAREGQAGVLTAMAEAVRGASSTALNPLRELGDTADEIVESLACLKDSKGLTPLHLACIKGHADAAGVLMELGANPFAMVSLAWQPTMWASVCARDTCPHKLHTQHAGPKQPCGGTHRAALDLYQQCMPAAAGCGRLARCLQQCEGAAGALGVATGPVSMLCIQQSKTGSCRGG